jgi:hypothetical protein
MAIPSERIDVIQDCGLPQDDLPDRVGDSCETGTAGRQPSGHILIVEPDADHDAVVWGADVRRRGCKPSKIKGCG